MNVMNFGINYLHILVLWRSKTKLKENKSFNNTAYIVKQTKQFYFHIVVESIVKALTSKIIFVDQLF